MYKFVIKSITGEILYTSVRTLNKLSDAQKIGSKFLSFRREYMPKEDIVSTKGNYVDVISV